MENILKAGVAAIDITPKDSQFLFGYPHVKRYSTGVHDPLLSSALFLSDGNTELIIIANDIVSVSKESVACIRRRIWEKTGVPAKNIMISATHTHSGPITVNYISNANDPVVPKADEHYIRLMEDGIVKAAVEAINSAEPAELGLAVTDSTGVGTNRHDPAGPSDMQMPVLIARSLQTKKYIGCMLVCSMHPTVLHEDSTLISGDFPGLARQIIQRDFLGKDCPVIYHTGPSGNQSPRHVTKENTFKEAKRLGNILAQAVGKVLHEISFTSDNSLSCVKRFVDLPKKSFPGILEAKQQLDKAVKELDKLKKSGATSQEVRTAEVNWFGAEETLSLAQMAQDGSLDAVYQTCLPAEIQVIGIGPWTFIGWQGEIFVEYSLKIKEKCKHVFIVSLANGDLQGYIVTPEAAGKGGYEASNSIFDHESGAILVAETLQLLKCLIVN
ncbi:MAG: neutral/alkaline non-lysosomal ceramidase N-terminal domain-containing protein [Bacteroidales bacterium]|nr:neutral/alkaline non-lysosomal ceramidase N-terminal domain-containing protein [Bacteroidales bacterium]